MKLSIRGVANRGEMPRERIILDVHGDTDLGDYLLMRTGYNRKSESVTIGVRHTYWFPYQGVSADDVVVLYSKEGRNNHRPDGHRTLHFYYWGEDSCLWGSEDCAAIILHAPDWDFVPPDRIGV